MSAVTLATSRKKWDSDEQNRSGDDDPDREHEIDDYAEAHDGYEPHHSITQGEAALHVASIGLPSPTA
jgi:hypothetical protein